MRKIYRCLAADFLRVGALFGLSILNRSFGPLDWGPVVGGYFGLVILSAGYLSLGLLASCVSLAAKSWRIF